MRRLRAPNAKALPAAVIRDHDGIRRTPACTKRILCVEDAFDDQLSEPTSASAGTERLGCYVLMRNALPDRVRIPPPQPSHILKVRTRGGLLVIRPVAPPTEAFPLTARHRAGLMY